MGWARPGLALAGLPGRAGLDWAREQAWASANAWRSLARLGRPLFVNAWQWHIFLRRQPPLGMGSADTYIPWSLRVAKFLFGLATLALFSDSGAK